MKQVVILISGRGSNLDAILQAARVQDWATAPGARIAAVISNRADAPGLALAQAAGIATDVLPHAQYATREDFDAALAAAIDRYAPQLVVLAGFMRVLTPAFVARYAGRLVNVHPSLLPSFPGLHTHRQALAAGVRVHGLTVHFVGANVDGGAIIAQAAVPVLPGDTEAQLAARVLAQEHLLYPRAIRMLLAGRVTVQDGRVQYRDIDEQLSVLAA